MRVRPLPWFSPCPSGGSKHGWIWSGFAHKVHWNDDHTEGRTVAGDYIDVAIAGPICAFCGILKRSFCEYPRPVAPMVAP